MKLQLLKVSIFLSSTISASAMERSHIQQKKAKKDETLTGYFIREKDDVFKIIEQEKILALRTLLKKGAINAGQVDVRGCCPLLYACERRSVAAVTELLTHEQMVQEIHTTDRAHYFPLYRAVESGMLALVAPLLAVPQLNLEQMSPSEKTSFELAIECRYIPIVIAFLDTKRVILTADIIDQLLELCVDSPELRARWLDTFDVNTYDERGDTLLIRTIKRLGTALSAEQKEVKCRIITLLIAQNDIIVQPYGINGSAYAQLQEVKRRIQGTEIAQQVHAIETSLQALSRTTCKVGMPADSLAQPKPMSDRDYVTSELGDQGSRREEKFTDLSFAVEKEDVKRVQQQLRSFDIRQLTANQLIEILYLAVNREDNLILAELLTWNSFRESITKSKQAEGQQLGCLDIPYETPLMRACKRTYIGGLHLFVRAAVQIMKPVDITMIFRTLMQAKDQTPDSWREVYSHPRLSINTRDSRGKTPLILAITDFNVIQYTYVLSQQGLDINAVDCHGLTALMHALQQNYKEGVLAICQDSRRASFKKKHIPKYVRFALHSADCALIDFMCSYFGYTLTIEDLASEAERTLHNPEFKKWFLERLSEIFIPEHLLLVLKHTSPTFLHLLLELPNIDIDVRDSYKQTFVEAAVFKRRYDLVELCGLLGARSLDETGGKRGLVAYQTGLDKQKQLLAELRAEGVVSFKDRSYLISLRDREQNTFFHHAILARNGRTLLLNIPFFAGHDQIKNQHGEIPSTLALRLFVEAARRSINLTNECIKLMGHADRKREYDALAVEKKRAMQEERQYAEILVLLKNRNIVFLLRDLLKRYGQNTLLHYLVRHTELMRAFLPALHGYIKTRGENNIRPIDLLWDEFLENTDSETFQIAFDYMYKGYI